MNQYGQYGNSPGINYNQTGPIIVNNSRQEEQALPSSAHHSYQSTKICCPVCKKVAMTRVETSIGVASCLWCLIIPFFGLFCLCNRSCLDSNHFCSDCGMEVGSKKKPVCPC